MKFAQFGETFCSIMRSNFAQLFPRFVFDEAQMFSNGIEQGILQL